MGAASCDCVLSSNSVPIACYSVCLQERRFFACGLICKKYEKKKVLQSMCADCDCFMNFIVASGLCSNLQQHRSHMGPLEDEDMRRWERRWMKLNEKRWAKMKEIRGASC